MMKVVFQNLNPSPWDARADHMHEWYGDLLSGCYDHLVEKNSESLSYLECAGGNQSDFWERLNTIN